MKNYIKYIKGNWGATIVAPLLMMVDVVCGLVNPFLRAKIIDIGIANNDKAYILKLGGIMVGVSFVLLLSGFGCMYFSSKAAYGFSANLREELIAKIQTFSFSNINKFKTSSLVTRLTNDVQVVTQLFQMLLRIAIRAPFMLIGGLLMSLATSKKLSIILAVLLPLLVILIVILLSIVGPLFDKLQKGIDKVNAIIRENLKGVKVIKSFVREDYEKDKFNAANNELKNISIKSFNKIVIMFPLISLALNITIAAILWFGSKLIMTNELEVGSLSSIIMYIIMTLSSLIMLSMVFINSARASASSKRILEVINEKVDIIDSKKAKDNKIEKGNVEFNIKKFVFEDSSGEEVLSNIKFNVAAGDVVAVIGGTGSGKTTLINLIPRFYDVTEGYVKVDDLNVKNYKIENLRDGIGMVLQENKLFKGTIKENLKWGNKKATDKEIKDACKVAQIHDYIMHLKGKYDYEVEQNGNNFSGGQKQRLCIARALLKNPKILILDDSVSALDATTEKKLTAALKKHFKNTTVFIITQRISSCKNADYVLIIDNGTIAGIESHEELLKGNEVYQEINSSQEEVVSNE